jgi:hypothetical protein
MPPLPGETVTAMCGHCNKVHAIACPSLNEWAHLSCCGFSGVVRYSPGEGRTPHADRELMLDGPFTWVKVGVEPRAPQEPAVESVRVERTIEIKPGDQYDDFLTLLTGAVAGTPKGDRHSGDVLIRGFSGWWLYGVDRTPELGWLVYDELANETRPSPLVEAEAVRRWREGDEALPGNFYRLDRATAMKVLQWGLAKWGDDFVDGTCDYGDYDEAVQTILLGEVVYG